MLCILPVKTTLIALQTVVEVGIEQRKFIEIEVNIVLRGHEGGLNPRHR